MIDPIVEMRNFRNHLPDLDGKVILVTGGTGSFGQRFVKQVLDIARPKKLIVFSRDEQKQYEMEQALSTDRYESIRYFLGDVRDQPRLEQAMRGVDYVVHAAAMKIVPSAEYNPQECVSTNILGAQNIVNAAISQGVKRLINLSTDKAVNPINLYGATKLAAEKIFTAANSLAGRNGTRFATVRYGNVIGSRGSVVPLFKRLVAEGRDSLPITDERMTRFWITLDQGVDFVLSSLELMAGGEVFVPKIPSMRMVDLTKAMAPGTPLKIIGIRPGEKLHEVLVVQDEARFTIELKDRFVIVPEHITQAGSNVSGKRVSEEFSYISNTNSEWLTSDALSDLVVNY